MDSQAKPTLNANPPKRSRKILGSVIAVAAMAGLGGLAWYLTHQPPAPAAAWAQGPAAPVLVVLVVPAAGGGGAARRPPRLAWRRRRRPIFR
jgi:multidrug efflux system membrane fusion protein